MNCVRERDVTSVQQSTTCSNNIPANALHDAATEAGKDTMFLIRVTHSSGMLEGKLQTRRHSFPPTDHRSHRPRVAAQRNQENRPSFVFSSNFRTHTGTRRHCFGCWPMIAWLDASEHLQREQLVESRKRPNARR